MTDDAKRDQLRLWTTDADGQSVLRGLSAEETAWHQDFADKELAQRFGGASPWASPKEFEADRKKWRELQSKHELARASVIFAEEKQRSDAEPTAKFKQKRRY